MKLSPLASFVVLFAVLAATASAAPPATLTITGGTCQAGFSEDHGALLFVKDLAGSADLSLASAENLWTLKLRDGTVVAAKDTPCRATRVSPTELKLAYEAGGGTITVTAIGSARGIDLSAKIAGLKQDVLELQLPASLSLDTSRIQRVLFPSYLGVALKPSFFKTRTEPASWVGGAIIGPDGLRKIAGVELRSGASDAPTAIAVTPLGRQFLGPELSRRWESHPSIVNRPPASGAEMDLLSSSGGSFLAGHKVGAGWLIRFGGLVRSLDGPLITETTERLLAAAARNPRFSRSAGRHKVVLLDMLHGPERGSWSDIALSDWRARLMRSAVLSEADLECVPAMSYSAILQALADPNTFAIVNPYGEWLPIQGADPNALIASIKDYLIRGGVWLGTGGSTFYATLQPAYRNTLDERYPGHGFSDFSRIESGGSAVSMYGVQDAHDEHHIFVPARWRAEGADKGGRLERGWETFVAHGATWDSPVIRLKAGGTPQSAILAYTAENGFDRPLKDKLTPRLLDLWRQCVHFKSNMGTAAEDTNLVDALPSPSILHIAHYLHGGFDKELPDHLPPNPKYGTDDEFAKLVAQIHQKGDLFMPYTNSTWWCDNPKGPTFQRAGDAALLRGLDGMPHRESYGVNTGWTVTPYHPAVLEAEKSLLDAFQGDLQADILFQDQIGARPAQYDFNSPSPTPYAYTQGLIELARRASERFPVSTEDGFDRLLNIESQFCGLTQSIGAIPRHKEMRYSQRLADEDWELFPIAQYIAHDKAFFMHHDLEEGAVDRTALAWTLALGYQLSTSVAAAQLQDAAKLEWFAQLDKLQKAFGPHYMGASLSSFRYLRGSGEHGVMEASYGDMRIVSNLTAQTYIDGQVIIAPNGFYARAGVIEAGYLTSYHGQAAENKDAFFFKDQ